MEDLEFAQYIVACHTNKCENKDIKIEVQAVAGNPRVMCGVCSTFIEDIVEV
jgi:hypothetical protein